MNVFVICFGSIFTLLSASVLAYISVATMFGPWIAPTIVLCGSMLLRFSSKSELQKKRELIFLQAMSSVGGIVAVAIGFALPILYFLDPQIFAALINRRLFFCATISFACLAAGSLGIFLGRFFAIKLITKEKLPFPVSMLTYQVISSRSQTSEANSLMQGILSSISLCILRDGIFTFKGLLPNTIHLLKDHISVILWPTLWAIGFTTGLTTAIPLIIGLLSKYLIVYPLNYHSHFIPITFFSPLKTESFITAFCSGLVLSEIILYIVQQPTILKEYVHLFYKNFFAYQKKILFFLKKSSNALYIQRNKLLIFEQIVRFIEPIAAITLYIAFFTFFNFSPAAQIFLFFAMIIAIYEINYISGEIGLLQFGRYSAFILIPTLLIFNINFTQITVLCVFFNICAATSSDLLFDYKTAEYEGIEESKIYLIQWAGLLVTTLSIGFIFYLLFNTFTIGSENFFAQRGRSKALLIQSLNFNNYVIAFGFFYGLLLKKMRISPTMTFGGILMPNHITIGFIIGGLFSYLTGDKKEKYLPFCSGVFTSESLWILLSLFLKII